MDFAGWVDKIDGWVWGYVMMFLLVGTGLYLTFRMRIVQIRLFKHGWSLISGKWDNPSDKGETTHLQALSTALSATIGTGNIAGVAAAMVAGGPGAVFWMWVTAAVGMCTKFTCCLLAQRYRTIDHKGIVAGGPMYYLRDGLGLPWLGWLFALFAAIACFGIGNMVQANSVADPISRYIGLEHGFNLGGLGHVALAKLGLGIVMALLVALVIIGGIRRIARVAEKIVPIMAVIYVLGALVILVIRISAIPEAFGSIFKGAFSSTSLAGGIIGFTISQAAREGVAKGLFSNESGLGSAAIAHAPAKTKEPVREGLVAMLGPFIDTIVICTMTALVIITSGLLGHTDADGAALSAEAFRTGLGAVGAHVVSFGLVFFAFTTMVGWSYYGDRSIYYLFGTRGDQAIRVYRWVFVALIPIGAAVELKVVWGLSGIFNGLMAFPNLVALIGLSGVVASLLRDYERRLPEMRPFKTRNDLWFLGSGRK
ncbi:alanine/glycine:cation symporter family protein [Candidatus Eisenbacteria bacterium]|uniref:Alanine/glycine:cation symporter family protein n=1 Tax=Eiseniibacteriota bacterium TaxID=2212470 RepID=A0ABV6YJI9_UNCEI